MNPLQKQKVFEKIKGNNPSIEDGLVKTITQKLTPHIDSYFFYNEIVLPRIFQNGKEITAYFDINISSLLHYGFINREDKVDCVILRLNKDFFGVN